MHSLFPKASRRAPEPAPVHFGNGLYHPAEGDVTGEHVTLEGEPYVCIRNVDALKPFFMSIVSDGDLWIFAGSNSPFTAGRSNPDQALFPYQTADKIMRNADSAGAMTLLLVRRGEGEWTLGSLGDRAGGSIPSRAISISTRAVVPWCLRRLITISVCACAGV
jgi:hypothetical protein